MVVSKPVETPVPVDLTNLAATRRLLSSLFHPGYAGDSWLPMQRALEILHGKNHHNLYETLFFGLHVRFQYPPTGLLGLDLLSHLGLHTLHALNALNSLVFLMNSAACATVAWLLFPSPARPDAPGGISVPSRAGMAMLAAALSFLFYPLVRGYLLGQIELWIDLLFTAAILCWILDRRWLSGALIGLACSIKPQFGLLLLWALLWRETGFVAGFVGALVPLTVLSCALYGLHNHLAYLNVLSFLSHHGEAFFANNSVNGILNWYLAPGDPLRWHDGVFTPYIPAVYLGTSVTSLAALALLIAPPLLQRRRRPELGDFAAAAILTVVGSPVAWEHHYGILFPLYLVMLRHVFDSAEARRAPLYIGLLVSWSLVATFIPFANLLLHTPFAALQAYCLFDALLPLRLFMATAPNRQRCDDRHVAWADVPSVPASLGGGVLQGRRFKPVVRGPALVRAPDLAIEVHRRTIHLWRTPGSRSPRTRPNR
jgi:hypothetical protein